MNKRLNQFLGKEQTEWSNFWYDRANENVEKRILLVGDSIARQIRRTLSEIIACPVDLFASSAALRDQMFWDQWECFFKNNLYKYNVIILWVGNHSRISENGETLFTEYDYVRFKDDFLYLVNECQNKSSKVIVLTTLHMYRWRKYNKFIELLRRKFKIKPKEILNEYENIVVEGKNAIMRDIANYQDLLFYDIDKKLMESIYWHVDFIHYIPESNIFVCNILKDLINKLQE